MSLKNLKFQSEIVETPGGNFTVRGLNLDDIKVLLREHMGELKLVFETGSEMVKQAEVTGDLDYIAFAGAMIHVAPNIVTSAIALGAGEHDQDGLTAAKALAASSQIIALEKIARLTFETEGGPKKVFEIVMQMAKNTKGMMPTNGTPSKNGSAASAGK